MRLAPKVQFGVSTVSFASVPPPVNVTSLASPPTSRAISLRAVSIRRRASRPSPCTDEALPTAASASTIAARASGRSGAVAL